MTDEIGRALNEYARHQMIVRLEQDILVDLTVCEITGADKTEYIMMLYKLLDSFVKKIGKGNDIHQ